MSSYDFDSQSPSMNGAGPAEPEERRGFIYAFIGCGGCLLLSLCLVPPAIYFLAGDDLGTGSNPFGFLEPTNPAELEPVEPGPPPPPGGGEPRAVVARVTEVSGLGRVREGSSCAFSVYRHPRSDGTFWCNVQVVCAEVLLYGGANAGFFDCTLYEQPQRHVVGEDMATSADDSDAAMRIDTIASELVVHDDASGRLGEFRVVAEVESLQ